MNTEQQITERAKQAEKEWLLSDDVTRYGYAQGYAHGATEQRKIDIDKAMECFELEQDWIAWSNGDWEYVKEYFRKTMEG